MKNYRPSFFIFFFVPVALVLVIVSAFLVWTLFDIKSRHDLMSAQFEKNLRDIVNASEIDNDLNEIHRRVDELLQQSYQQKLDESQVYQSHVKVVDQLAEADRKLQALAGNFRENEMASLRKSFDAYRNLVVTATDIIAVDPSRAGAYIKQAASYYVMVDKYAGQVIGMLTKHANTHNKEFSDDLQGLMLRTIAISLIFLALIALLWFTIARWMTRQMTLLSSSLQELAEGGSISRPEQIAEICASPINDPLYAMARAALAFADAIAERNRSDEELRASESRLRSISHALGERVKEQQCLYAVFAITDDPASSLDEQMQRVVARIGSGWQYPEITAVRLEHGGAIFASPDFVATPWMQVEEEALPRGDLIRLTVAYREERPPEDEGPFLKEERSLARTIVRRLADVVKRRQAAAALKEQERLISTMFAQTTDSIVLVDTLTNRFVEFNDAAHQGLGYTREEFARLSVADIQGEHTDEQIAANTEQTASGILLDLQTRHRHKDGSLQDVILTLRPLSLEGRSLISAVWRDITEQKIREGELAAYRQHLEELVAERTAALRSANEEQRAIFEAATAGIVQVQDRVILSCNKRLEEIFGYGHGELIGQSTRCWYENDEVFDRVGRDIAAQTDGAGLYRCDEILLVRKDGSRFWARMNASMLRLGNAAQVTVGVLEDITAEHDAVQALRNAKDVAEAANRAKSHFLATMSHELRSPLTAILGLSEILREELDGPLNQRQQSRVTTIEESGRHLLQLINDILDLAKIEANKQELRIDEIEVEALCRSSLLFVKELATKKNISLSLTFRDNPDVIRSDARRLKQILVNLLSNAVKFTPDGGRVGLEVTGVPEREELHFAVSDSGIGISREDMAKLFQPFTQIDSTLSRKYEGTGLGLSLVVRLSELLGGGVAVASTPGLGSRFTVTLPFGECGAGRPGETAETVVLPDLDATGAATVLVVDDSRPLNEMMSDYLTLKGYRTIAAYSGDDAITLVRKEFPDLALMDVQMPGMDGLTAIRQIRLLPPPENAIPIVALTALAMPGDRETCLGAGATAYLSKPVNMTELNVLIRNLLVSPKERNSHA